MPLTSGEDLPGELEAGQIKEGALLANLANEPVPFQHEAKITEPGQMLLILSERATLTNNCEAPRPHVGQ